MSGAQIRDHYTKSGRTLAIPAAPTDAYGQAVYNDDPGPVLAAERGLRDDRDRHLTQYEQRHLLRRGRVQRKAGAVSDPAYAASFDGNDDLVSSNAQINNPKNYSEEIWFKTTTNAGGKLIGFGASQTGTSGNYDRHVYMSNDGKVTFGVWTGFTNTITTDNASERRRPGTTWWPPRVRLWAWRSTSTASGSGRTVRPTPRRSVVTGGSVATTTGAAAARSFAGTLDEAAIYTKVLTAAQVKAHYEASSAATNDAPVAAFTATCTMGIATSTPAPRPIPTGRS